MADGSASGKRHPITGHEECYIVPEVVRIAVLPIPEGHGICSPAPSMLVYIALVMDFKENHRDSGAHVPEMLGGTDRIQEINIGIGNTDPYWLLF